MRFFILISFLIITSIVHSDELELNCKFDKYNAINNAYSQRVIKSWAPETQSHVVNQDRTSFWSNWQLEGQVKVNDSKKVKIKYKLKTQKYITHYDFIFFKTTKKATIFIEFPGYIAPGSIWGSCTERKNIDKNTVKKTNENKENLENISDSMVCYRYGLYNGKYIKEAQRRNLNCESENKDKDNSSVKTINKTEPAENKCKELGFSPGTESFGNCVLKLMD